MNMKHKGVTFSVFTKPWKDIPVVELGRLVRNLGFDAIEFPVRPGYQVEPENVQQKLPELVRELADLGLKVASIAGPTDEATFAACAAAGVPIIRVMYLVGADGYMASEKHAREDLDRVVPLCERYGVKVGVQNHCGFFVAPNSMGIRHLIEDYDPRFIGAIWDAAHNALNGEEPEMGLDIVWSHLCMVNLKNAYWRRTNGPEAENAEWKPYWTTGRQGLASWPRVVAYLNKRSYQGVVCLTAEYTADNQINRLIAEDIAFAKSLFEQVS